MLKLCFILLVSSINIAALRLPTIPNPLGTPQKLIDLRSDTVTRPSQAMRTAMYEAEVGDDVYGEDPTVNNLELRTAKLLEKEAGLFFPTGTMSNLAALMSWCDKRDAEMLLGESSHMFLYEQGGMAQIGGVTPRTLRNEIDGSIDIDTIEKSIRSDNIHYTKTSLIALENTHNYCGGTILPSGYVEAVRNVANKHNIPVHLDGARLWNAAAALKTPVASLVTHVDSASVCLSKGLGAPAGSILVGPHAFIERARRIRKVLGGGMRQVGVLAATGMVALNDFESGMLANDHTRAKRLADGIRSLPGFDVKDPDTNIILISLDTSTIDPLSLTQMLKEKRILVLPFGHNVLRLVTHKDISDDDVTQVINTFKEVAVKLWPRPNIADLQPSQSNDFALTKEVPVTENVKNTVVIPSTNDAIDESKAAGLTGFEIQEYIEESAIISVNDNTPAVNPVVYYEEVVVHGMSVSPDGFCVLLRGTVCDRVLKILVTPSDPMADGLDREQVETSEAVTLLQLLQGIDVESHLAKDALNTKFADANGVKVPYNLRRVLIDTALNARTFSATLCGALKDSASSNTNNADTDEFDVVTSENNIILPNNNDVSLSPSSILSELLPPIVNSDDVAATPSEMSFTDNPPVMQHIDKEVKVDNAFIAIALALRHGAVIEVQSSLLQNKEVSYDLDSLKLHLPKMLEADNGSDANRRYSEDYDSRSEMERLQRQLFEAIRQGNKGKIDKIKKELEFYSILEGKSVLIQPPPASFYSRVERSNMQDTN